ncbi:hypothetical protein NQZ68_021691 [Dissostichus eleginoides]|nr:hypothetical protein NQZ68_021691 [Dissostichus eleginoides]
MKQLFVTVSQGLRWKERRKRQMEKKKEKNGRLADPFLGGRPAGVTSANAYTLNLWAADEDRTLTKRQRKREGEGMHDLRRRGRMSGKQKINKEKDNRMRK